MAHHNTKSINQSHKYSSIMTFNKKMKQFGEPRQSHNTILFEFRIKTLKKNEFHLREIVLQ